MNFSVFSETEVRYQYNHAKDKTYMLRALAELTCSTEAEMAEFLGVELPQMKKIDTAKAYELYKAGKTDGQIAKELDVSKSSVNSWRNDRGLPLNKRMPDTSEMMDAYRRGLSDRQAANELGIGKSSFCRWRNANGLPPNKEKEKAK